MKKKAALLLALVMVLSMLPMSVFGGSLLGGRLPHPSGPLNSGQPQIVTVRIPVADLIHRFEPIPGASPAAVGARLLFELGPDSVLGDPFDHAAFAPHGAAISSTTHASLSIGVGTHITRIDDPATDYDYTDFHIYSDPASLNVIRTNWPGTARTVTIETILTFDGGADLIPQMRGSIDIDIVVVPQHPDTTLTVTWVSRFGGERRVILPTQNIVAPAPIQGVTFSAAGGARAFQQGLILPRITITERAQDSMTHNIGTARTIRLIAPFDYGWNVGIPGAVGQIVTPLRIVGVNGALQTGTVDGQTGVVTTAVPTVATSLTDDGRHILDLTFNIRDRAPGLAGDRPAVIGLEGLMLVALPGAPAESDINIDISWGLARENAASTSSLNAASVMTHWEWWAPNWRHIGLTVGARGGVALEMGISGAAPTLVSGIVGPGATPRGLRPGQTAAGPARGAGASDFPPNNHGHANNNAATFGHATRSAMLQIRELTPSALDTGFLHSLVYFTMPEGVQLVHANWRINSATGGARLGAAGAGSDQWMAIPEGIEIGGTNIPTGLLDTAFIGLLGAPFRTTDYMQIFVPTNPVPTAARTLEVFFYFSVEAGYVEKFDTNEIAVTVGGPAIAALGDAPREIVVANVTDPISVSLDGAMLQVETGRTHNLMERTPIGNIEITEDAAGRLRVNDVFWVYVMGTNIQRPSTLAFHTNNIATVNAASGMRLDPGQPFRTQLPNGLWVEGISFRVARASTSPATITLTNNELFGEILPGQDYVAVVSGPRVAANELQVAGRAGVAGTGAVYQWAPNPDLLASPPVIASGTALTLQHMINLGVITAAQADAAATWPGDEAGGVRALVQAWAVANSLNWGGENWFNNLAGAGRARTFYNNSNNATLTATQDINIPIDWTNPANWVQVQVAPGAIGVINADTQGIFDSLPYGVQVIEWVGFDPHVAPPAEIEGPGLGGISTLPVTFSPATIINNAPALIISDDGATLIQARAFTEQFGGDISRNGNVVTATGFNRRTGELTTVVMQLGQSTVTIDNGAPVDIATIVGQPTMVGLIVPVNEYDRLYVPVRFLAEVFGIPFSRTSGNGIRFN